jgi:serine/threonine protein kinase/tetratricopeptide (TPR) repeat protein
MIFSRDYVRKGDLEYRKGNLRRAAEQYLKAKRFDQAAQVFVEAGNVEKAVEIYVDAGDPRKAADLLAAEGRYKEAISRYEDAGAYAQAAEACLKVQRPVRAGRLFEQAQMFRRAAEVFTEAGEIEHALRVWETASENLRSRRTETRDPVLEKKILELDAHRAEILSNVGRHLEAAELMAEHGRTTRAAPLYERAGAYAEAAKAYLEAGRMTQALAAIEQAADADQLKAEIYLGCARYEEAGEIFERLELYDAAASAYEGAEAWARAASMWEQAESYGRAAGCYERIERYADASRCFAEAGQHDRAAAAFTRAGNDQGAADAFLAANKPFLAGEHYERAGLAEAAIESFEAVPASSPDYGRASQRLIPLLIEHDRLEAAQDRLELLREQRTGVDGHALDYCQGRVEEALGRYSEAEIHYQKALTEKHDYRDVGERLRDVRGKVGGPAGDWLRARPNRRDTEPMVAGALSRTAPAKRLAIAAKRPPMALAAAPAARAQPLTSLPALDSADLPFRLEERIDPWWSGAEFFRATDSRTERPILLVSFPLAEVGSQLESFRHGMRQVQALGHPTILKLKEVARASDKVLLLYDAFSGETLSSRLAEQRLSATTSLNLIVQLAEALSTAHKLGVTHQWVSPRTILIDELGRIKLVGIGLRDVLADRDEGARGYMSPEVLDAGVIGPASDVYSLGLLALVLLTGEAPAVWAQRQAIDAESVAWPPDVLTAVPGSTRRVLIRALARDALQRPSTAELSAALSSAGLVPGQILADRYEILGELGRGGMSRVYRATDRGFPDEEVAIKTLLTPALGGSEDEERLMNEVKICRKISHPNVVRVHDYGRFPGGVFVTMELLDGPGLDLVIEHEAPLPEARVRDILKGIASALSEAHRLKVIHRDLKPSNVILVDDRVKVLDFGIARMGDASSGANLTRTGEVIGSPMFMSPEQIQGLPLAGTCDLYALGVIAYALLTGREPFHADTTTAIVFKHLNEPPPDPRERNRDLSQEWIDLVNRLLAKKPADRYQSADELLEALAGLPV